MQWAKTVFLAAAVVALGTARAEEFDVPGTGGWVDTKIDVRAQDELTISATGQLKLADGKTVTPSGATRGFRDMIRTYPVNEAGQAALIGRLGDSDAARAFLIGSDLQWRAPRSGRLYLGINKSGGDAPSGQFQARVEITRRAPENVTENYKLPEITTEIVDQYSRRIQDAQGNLGDNTNFLVVGSEQQVLNAFKAAGWAEVDRSNEDAILAGVIAVLGKKAYVTLPMSELMLFGRAQDHGMAQADPLAVIAERHHFRIWKAPFQVDGSDVFVGAGTHDIGFDRDQRNNGVTHKIDPEVDKERDYIGKSLQESGLVAKLDYVMPSKPSQEALTATGATFRSDGRILVIYLVPEAGAAPVPASTGTTSIFEGVGK